MAAQETSHGKASPVCPVLLVPNHISQAMAKKSVADLLSFKVPKEEKTKQINKTRSPCHCVTSLLYFWNRHTRSIGVYLYSGVIISRHFSPSSAPPNYSWVGTPAQAAPDSAPSFPLLFTYLHHRARVRSAGRVTEARLLGSYALPVWMGVSALIL